MRSYRVVEHISSIHRSFIVYLYEAGIEESEKKVFESRERAYEYAMRYVNRDASYFDDGE